MIHSEDYLSKIHGNNLFKSIDYAINSSMTRYRENHTGDEKDGSLLLTVILDQDRMSKMISVIIFES